MHDLSLEARLLARNEELARQNSAELRDQAVYAFNLMGGPGCGKTSLLERTADALHGELRLAVVVGDMQGSADAERIAQHGVLARQINTGAACHLDALMLHRTLDRLELEPIDVLAIENVGNLACPAEFDLGEAHRVVMLSAAEGGDKPGKYPLIFHRAHVVILSKIDLAEHCDFDQEAVSDRLRTLNPDLTILTLSCRTGEGLDGWLDWLRCRVAESHQTGSG